MRIYAGGWLLLHGAVGGPQGPGSDAVMEEKLQFSAQDLGRLMAHATLSKEPPIIAGRDWLKTYGTNSSAYMEALRAYRDGLNEYLEQELAE